MRFGLSFLFAILCIANVHAQNHVPDPGFEDLKKCPAGVSQVNNYYNKWAQFGSGTPDCLNTCATSSYVGVPDNLFGHQWPAEGKGYVGIYAYLKAQLYREYIYSDITPLQIGDTYEVSMSVSPADGFMYGVHGPGVLFTDKGGAPMPSLQYVMPNVPQVSYENFGLLTDTSKWTRLVQYFVADSAYKRIIIGNFKDNAHTDTAYIGVAMRIGAYFFIDSVVVRKASPKPDTVYIEPSFTLADICGGDMLWLPYNVNHVFGLGNDFTAQLSDAAGSFSNPYNIGTVHTSLPGTIICTIPVNIPVGTKYRIRIVATNGPATSVTNGFDIRIASYPVLNLSADTLLCAGDTLSLDAGVFVAGTGYKWSGPKGFSSTLKNAVITKTDTSQSGFYTVVAQLFTCISNDSIHISVKPSPLKPIVESNSPRCAGDTLRLNVRNINTSYNYSWAGPGNFNATTTDILLTDIVTAHSGIYVLTASLGNCTVADSANVVVNSVPVAFFRLDSVACIPGSQTLEYYLNATGVDYHWLWGDAIIAGAPGNGAYDLHWDKAGHKTIGLKVTSPQGCAASYSRDIDVYNRPPARIEFEGEQNICSGVFLPLAAQQGDSCRYEWLPAGSFISLNDDKATARLFEATDIYLNVTNQWQCNNSDTLHFETHPCCEPLLPDAFSPNGDGINDQFRLLTASVRTIVSFIVVNRWGQVVYTSNDPGTGWDGTFNGVPQEIGTYNYYTLFRCSDDQLVQKKGTVILVR